MLRKGRHNFLQRLIFRELYGEFRQCRSAPKKNLFACFPIRLAFPLSLIAPSSALAGGHVFLGFTKCGQFLLSYTYSCDTDFLTFRVTHKYKLHWWLFVPYARLKKIAEVMLFGGEQDLHKSIYENVYIYLCQWPKDLTKILVYGCCIDCENNCGSQTKRVYVTVTAVPSLNNCSACYQVATSYEDDDLAECWNGCARFSCLQHGVTIHTSFEIVPPFPHFIPSVQLKREGVVVLNAGNFIHVLYINLENIQHKKGSSDTEMELFNISCLSQKKNSLLNDSDVDNESESEGCNLTKRSLKEFSSHLLHTKANDSAEEDTYCSTSQSSLDGAIGRKSLKDKQWEILVSQSDRIGSSRGKSPERRLDGYKKLSLNDCDISSISSDCSNVSCDLNRSFTLSSPLTTTCIEFGSNDYYSDASSHVYDDVCRFGKDNIPIDMQPKRKSKLSDRLSFSNKCIIPTEVPSCSSSGGGSSRSASNTKQAEEEYEFKDEINENRREKLSVFRLRRLADKKYEFSDENSENVLQPFSNFCHRGQLAGSLQSQRSSRAGAAFEFGESCSASPTDVLRTIDQNIASPVLSPADDRWREEFEKMDKVEMMRSSSQENLSFQSSFSPLQKVTDSPQPLECVVDIKRSYIEVDDELVSVITEIEDDELSTATGYHNALPLEVHGSGYSQMHMVSNSKADKLMAPGVFVRQVSLDVDQFCHETAQRLCAEAGQMYYFCNDYNVEIIDVCPSSGNVIAFASVLVQAGSPGVKLSKKYRNSTNARKLYKSTTTFVFNSDSKTYYLLDKEPLVLEDLYSYDVHDGSSENDDENCSEWWQHARKSSRRLRMQWATPTDYYSGVKVMTNEPLVAGKSLSHIVEGYHHVAIVL